MTTWWTWRTSQVSFALCLGLYLLPLRFWARPAMWLGANMFLWFNFAAQEVGNYLAQEVRAPKSWLKSQASRAAHPNVSPSARMNFRPPSWYIHHKRPQLTLLGRVSPIFPLSPISHPLHELTNYTTLCQSASSYVCQAICWRSKLGIQASWTPMMTRKIKQQLFWIVRIAAGPKMWIHVARHVVLSLKSSALRNTELYGQLLLLK